MKKAFTLLFTLLFLSILGFVCIKLLENRAINSINIKNQYLYIQASNHLEFLSEYIKTLKDIKEDTKIEILDDKFIIEAYINKNKADIFVKAKEYNIRVYKTLILLHQEP
ncbi:hypothetical protein [Malaciobacter mytili]|uniref:hypothetical protein n=1 Tax=Malaciobacter mytili TaxID=603050 RepID=UPI00100BC6EC|nr:hypothetical protein [Malaciobacter mytili]RXI40804.1 hypothetical protein CRU99_10055 [Malaciobacter mytili]